VASNGGQGSRLRQMHRHQRSYMMLGFLNTRPRTTYMVRVMNPNPRIRKPVEDPFGHGHDDHHDDAGHDGHGHSSAGSGEPGMSRSAFLRDGSKKLADKGYALSLRVLGSIV
jgi:hypothetical protein